MDSLEDEELFQMVHDFLESESAPPIPSSSQANPLSDDHTKSYILEEILESGTAAEIDALRSVLKHMRKKADTEKTTSLKKWLVMRLRKDGYDASLCHTSWPTSLSCPGGDYEYIEVVIEDMNRGSKRLIIDIDFKSQFELARPTSTYRELSDKLPTIFVGDANKLNKIISILCSEAKHSLRERGLHVPPWRTSTYMQSKWLANSRKIPCTPANEVGRSNQELEVNEFV